MQAKLAAAEAAAQGAASAEQLDTLQQRIAKLEAQKAGLNDALQAGQAEIAALQVRDSTISIPQVCIAEIDARLDDALWYCQALPLVAAVIRIATAFVCPYELAQLARVSSTKL